MFALGRVFVVGFAVLTVFYLCLWYYARALHRRALEAEWTASGSNGDLETFVQNGLARYEVSLRRNLILSVYVIPTLCIGALIYLTTVT